MIFEAAISNRSGELIIKEPSSIARIVFDFLVGLFLSGVGCLIFFLLWSGGGLAPVGNLGRQLLGWTVLIIAAFIPLVWGLRIIFERRSFRINDDDSVLLSLRHFAGVRISTRRYPFPGFDRVTIRPATFGFMASHIKFAVSCDGRQHLDLAVFDEHPAAVTFATRVAAQMQIPVQKGDAPLYNERD